MVVGNRLSGSLSIVDLDTNKVVAEHPVARQIAQVRPLGDRSPVELLVLDDRANRLLKVVGLDGAVAVRTIGDAHSSGRLAVCERSRRVFLSARWQRQVTCVTLDDSFERVESTSAIVLPFAPREMLLVDNNQRLLIADAFGGRVAAVDLRAGFGKPVVHEIAGHNIRGLALSPDGRQVHLAHQRMVPRALADYEELHWGRMLANGVRTVAADAFAEPGSSELPGWLDAHGGIGGATGDPSAVLAGPDGLTVVAFSGVGEVAVRTKDFVKRLPVGSHPIALAVSGDRLFVANRFDDSVTEIDVAEGKPVRTISLGASTELTAVQRGERLFFDARLSHEGWMSCHSCHTDGHSSGLIVDTLGDGDYGAPKRVPSLLGTRGTGPWGWTGGMKTLADQVRQSVVTTMHGDALNDAQTSDLVAYLNSLKTPPAVTLADADSIRHGQRVFLSQRCVDCHATPALTSPAVFDVGLVDERHRRRFNPPTLRGVGQRHRYFHDGRAASLEDVVLNFRHQIDQPMTEADASALLAYLRSL